MALPQKPLPPSLVNDDARGFDSLTVTWPDAAGAQSYNARITDEGGATNMTADVSRPFTFSGLSPTKKYVLAVQSKNADGVSPWSDDFSTRTRPNTPSSPTITRSAAMPIFIVKWTITAPGGAFAVLRQIGNGSDVILIPNAPLTGARGLSSFPSGKKWTFRIRTVLPQSDMPGGINESFWSAGAAVTTVGGVSLSSATRKSYGIARRLKRSR